MWQLDGGPGSATSVRVKFCGGREWCDIMGVFFVYTSNPRGYEMHVATDTCFMVCGMWPHLLWREWCDKLRYLVLYIVVAR